MRRLSLALLAFLTLNAPVLSSPIDPDVRVPYFSSVKESCEFFHARNDIYESSRRLNMKADLEDGREWESGRILRSEYAARTSKRKKESRDLTQRYIAGAISVLRAMGYSDWEMYSRHNGYGIGDLVDYSYAKVGFNPEPPYKYYGVWYWMQDIKRACRRYE